MKKVQVRPGVFVAISDQTAAKAQQAFAAVAPTRAQMAKAAKMDVRASQATAMAGPTQSHVKQPKLIAA